MPPWLRKMLEEGAKVTAYNKIGPDGTLVRVETIANETPGLVDVLACLSDLDYSVERAYYCSHRVRHITKMPKEGGFCGYRNIQMLISYIRDAQADGHWHFQDKIPSILKLQDMIERAWEMGFNSNGKAETGGIRLTRKYIGTPEAQALFLSLTIDCEASAFMQYTSLIAYESLLIAVGEYFMDDKSEQSDEKIVMTNKPPIYFQHAGHSMTIVGLEVRTNGSINLVVFDPMFNPSPAMKKLAGLHSFRVADPRRLIRAHRRGETYLSRYKDFEILT
jgi:zinc finger-containing ubiquitin peptidase 1